MGVTGGVVKYLTPKHADMAAKKVMTNCSALFLSRYVNIPYEMTQLSTNLNAALVDVAVWPSWL